VTKEGRLRRGHRGRDALLLLVLTVALAGAPAAANSLGLPAQRAERRAVVKVEGNRLTVTLDEIPLREALRDIAKQTGFRIVERSPLDDRLSLAFANLPLEVGLRRLLGRHDVVFVYGPAGGLEEVRVYASSRPAPFPSRPSPVAVIGPGEAQTFPPMLIEPDPAQRLAAALALVGTTEAAKALGVVRDLLTPHYEPEVRARALAALTLFEPMLGDPEPAQRLAAAHALAGTHAAARALDVVLDLLAPHYEPEVRVMALGALSFFDAVPMAHVTELALFDQDRSFRLEAVELLNQLAEHNPTARHALRQVADGTLDEAVREQATALLNSLEPSSD
jgi:HEAT repeats